MAKGAIQKNSNQHIKQLLNFVEKECEEYDISEYKTSILAMYGNNMSRLINLRIFIQLENKTDLLNFFKQKKQESAIKKRLLMAIHSIMSRKRDNKFYEIELKKVVDQVTLFVGAIKFHSQNNVRIICREYSPINEIHLIMIEPYAKKVDKNNDDGKYGSRLESATKIIHYYIEKETKKKIYL